MQTDRRKLLFNKETKCQLKYESPVKTTFKVIKKSEGSSLSSS